MVFATGHNPNNAILYHNIALIQEQVASVMTSLWSLVEQAEGIVLQSGLPPNSAQQTQTNAQAEHGLEQP